MECTSTLRAKQPAETVAGPSELAKGKEEGSAPLLFAHRRLRPRSRCPHFLTLFGQTPWLTIRAKEPRTSEAFDTLHALWQSYCLSLTDAVLDEAAEIMLDIAKKRTK